MRTCRTLFLIFGALLFCAPAFGGGSPTVFVTDGASGHIYNFTPPTTTTPSTVTTIPSATLEGLVFGPDNNLYVCAPAAGQIWRVASSGSNTAATKVFQSGFTATELNNPQCGRFDSMGNFYVTDELANSGVWKFSKASLAGLLPTTPTNVFTSSQLGGTEGAPFGGDADLTQSNQGDFLILDSNNGRLISSANLPGPLVSGLDNPVGIARSSTGDIFIAEQGSSNKVVRYTSGGTLVGNCGVFGTTTGGEYTPDIPFFIKFSADDTLYVATSQPGEGPINGKLWKEDISACGSPSFLTDLPIENEEINFPAIGVALPPTSTTPQGKSFSTNPRSFNLDPVSPLVPTFTSFQITAATSSCSATLTGHQTLTSALQTAISTLSLPAGTKLVPYLGEAAFGTVYHVGVESNSDCVPATILIGAFTPALTNPRIIKCDSTIAGTCSILEPNAVYPLGGPLPGDGSLGGSAGGFSDFFVIDEGLSTDPSVKGNFCEFNSPLTNTTDPASAPVFSLSTTGTIPVKFLLGKTASCKSFITDATALLSVAEVDSQFVPIFPLKFNGQGNSSAVFGLTGKQYHLNLDVSGYAPGTYSVSVTFLSGNAPPVTTYFTLVP